MFTERRANSKKTRRTKLPWPKTKPYKILALDGGGIRGVYGACLLARIESQITKGTPIANYFDTIAGTSTGGIIAIGLGLGIKTDEIEALYRKDGARIFKQPNHWKYNILKLFSWIRRPLYDYNELERLLKQTFGSKILGDSASRLIIPAFQIPKTEIAVFKTDHHPDFKYDWETPAWKVARATSAAPTYFCGHENLDTLFLDGGVWCNNPIMAALVDAITTYDLSFEQIQILSIGTGNPPFEIPISKAKTGLFAWREVIKAAMFLTTDNAQAQATLLLGQENICRLEPSEGPDSIELDDWARAIEELPEMANSHFLEHHNSIIKFFETEVSARHRFYT